MLESLNIEDYQLIKIKQLWFKGIIYLNHRVKIFNWQKTLLEKFISRIVRQSPEAQDLKLDFHILINSDQNEKKYFIDLFIFIDGIVLSQQNIFNNAFSGIYWGLAVISDIISQICDSLISFEPLQNIDNTEPELFDTEKSETIH